MFWQIVVCSVKAPITNVNGEDWLALTAASSWLSDLAVYFQGAITSTISK